MRPLFKGGLKVPMQRSENDLSDMNAMDGFGKLLT
jgi:hypothetical protein